MITDQEIAEIEARAKRATAGPWVSDDSAVPYDAKQKTPFSDSGASIENVIVGGSQDEQGGAVGILRNEDADFIAHSRADIPALLADRAELVERVRVLEAMQIPLMNAAARAQRQLDVDNGVEDDDMSFPLEDCDLQRVLAAHLRDQGK